MWALTLSEMKECGWLNRELVAQIELTMGQPDALRHAGFAGLRKDKEARQICGNSLAQGLDRPGTEQPSTHGDHQRRVPAPKPRTNVERAVISIQHVTELGYLNTVAGLRPRRELSKNTRPEGFGESGVPMGSTTLEANPSLKFRRSLLQSGRLSR